MKKLFLILTTALFAAGFASCTDDPEETVNPVVVSEILRALGGNVLVNVPSAKVRVLSSSETLMPFTPATQQVPMPRATTAACEVMPPRAVMMPSDTAMPSISSGEVS